MCLSLTRYMSEMGKWFEVHFAMSKISGSKILKLSLVSVLLFDMIYLYLLCPQTGMIHLRFDFFLQWTKTGGTCQMELFIRIGFPEKCQRGDGGRGGGYLRTYLLKNLGVIKSIFKTLQFLSLLLYHWKLLTKESYTPGNSRNLCYALWKFHIFSWSPLDILNAYIISSMHLEIPWL